MMPFDYEDLIGTPFEYGGRPPAKKLDCYGVVMECYRRMGLVLPERQFAEQPGIVAALMSMQMDVWEECPRVNGAVLLFRIMGVAQHVGVIVNPYEFIHTWEGSGGVVTERIDDWERRIVGCYRYTG